MKGFTGWFALALSAILLLNGCSRQQGEASNGSNDKDSVQIQPGNTPEESENFGYLALKILKVYKNQKPLEQWPWHADGGEWTFLECELPKDATTKVWIGTTTHKAENRDIPLSWGEAVLSADNTTAAKSFVEAFAKAFHVEAPASHGSKPQCFVKMSTAVLGSNLVRGKGGGFGGDGKGTWTAAKWFLEDDTAEAEVFFNYSIAEKRAEFSEKDEDYREDLMQQFVVGLRDGPLPERTPENDPSLTLVGPKVTDWKQIGGSGEQCDFTPNGDAIVIVASEHGTKSRIHLAPAAQPSERKLLAQFEGLAYVQQFLPQEKGLSLLVIETIRKNKSILSSTDPQKLWLVTGGTKRELAVPPGITNWSVAKNCISPDGRFMALHTFQRKPKGNPSRSINLCNLENGQWRTAEMPDAVLELAGWQGNGENAVVLTGFEHAKKRMAYLLDPRTGKLTSLDAVPPEFDSVHKFSPNGKRSMEVIGKEKLVISDTATKVRREFMFHPYDRRSVYPESVQWVDDRYILFQGARSALIDSDTLKMNFASPKGLAITAMKLLPNTKIALGSQTNGVYLGAVQTP